MSLSHLNDKGEANMVDISSKEISLRTATASGRIKVNQEVLKAISTGDTPKGDVLATARIAGILGAKKTSELIPLCHQIALSKIDVTFEIDEEGISISSTAVTSDRTGIEMEALTAVSIAALTLFDMIKAMDRLAVIEDIRLESKSGGKSGPWSR